MPQELVKKIVTIVKDGIQVDHEMFDENTTFTQWDRQNNAIKNWINSLISSAFLKYLINKYTTLDYRCFCNGIQ